MVLVQSVDFVKHFELQMSGFVGKSSIKADEQRLLSLQISTTAPDEFGLRVSSNPR